MVSGSRRCLQTRFPATRTGTSRPYFTRNWTSESTSTFSKSMPSARSSAAISSQRWQPWRPYSLALVSEARDGDEGGVLAAAHLEGEHGVLVEPGEELGELVHALELGVLPLVHHGEEHVALAHVGLRIRPHVGDDEAVVHVERLLLLRRELAHHDAEAIGGRFGLGLLAPGRG